VAAIDRESRSIAIREPPARAACAESMQLPALRPVPMDLSALLSALLAIVVIDIVLAGDNAIVIALAARSLPPRLRKRAIVWGTVGAVVVRSAMTVVVVWLLKIPGLLLAGGVLLLWIGYKLLLPEEPHGHDDAPAAKGFWSAMRTIVVADAVMGLDNVLAVAGAAHGNYGLVVVGLAVSVPIVVWGSTLVLKVVERYPAVVYAGAGVLAWTAAKMIAGEPLLAPAFAQAPALQWAVYAAIPLVLWAGFVKNHRRFESRIHARLAEFAQQRPAAAVGPASVPATASFVVAEGDRPMLKVLVPIDGSTNALRALRHAMAEYQRHHELELHLLNVQPKLSHHVARFVARSDIERWHREQAEAASASARALLDRAGVPYRSHWAVGDRALEICRAAKRLQVHHIVMGTARKNSLTRMLQDSTTNKVLERTSVPVELIAGDAVSRLERWGIPAGAGALLAVLIAAID
jgi:YjbE family integral membrane protein